MRGKLFASLWPEGDDLVIRMALDDRDVLVKGDPEVFHVTDRRHHAVMVLVGLTTVRGDRLAQRLEHSWNKAASKRLVAEFEARDRGQTPRVGRAKGNRGSTSRWSARAGPQDRRRRHTPS